MKRTGIAAALLALAALTGCTSVPAGDASSAGATSSGPTGAPTSGTPSPTAAPTPTPPLPPVQPGRARGEMLFVQRAEDASIVSGDRPIRLTLARTGNRADWFAAPPQRQAGSMSTNDALLNLGWRPADDGTTATMPTPRPNGLLSYADGSLAFTVYRANVRGDGTLVLDINPIGPMPDTVASLGPVTLTLDGVPGVLVVDDTVGIDLTVHSVISGNRNQQAVVQLLGGDGEVAESRFLARDRPVADDLGDVATPGGTLTDIVIEFMAPTRTEEGRITVSGTLDVDGASTAVEQVVARWSLPEE